MDFILIFQTNSIINNYLQMFPILIYTLLDEKLSRKGKIFYINFNFNNLYLL